MKKIVFCTFTVLSFFQLYGDDTKADQRPKSPNGIYNPQDETDALAIPLDESEAEEKEDEKDFLQKKKQKNHSS